MNDSSQTRSVQIAFLTLLLGLALLAATTGFAADTYTTKPFSGVKVNGGTATLSKEGMQRVLTLSDDFKVPEAPDPHWQLVDSKGTVYPLDRLVVKPDKVIKKIKVPTYVDDIAKVQIWCSFAEALLGEAPFEKPVK